MLRGRWSVVILILTFGILGVLGYGWVSRVDWGREWVEWWYAVQAPRQGERAFTTMVIPGAPRGTDLFEYGLKMIFVSGVRFERVWRVVGSARYFLVFAYDYKDKTRWLIVPVNGQVSVSESSRRDAQRIEPSALSKTLAKGQSLQLAFLHRFSGDATAEAAREELLARRVRSTNMSREEAEREIGQFPAKVQSDHEVRAILGGAGVVVLDEAQLLLLDIAKL